MRLPLVTLLVLAGCGGALIGETDASVVTVTDSGPIAIADSGDAGGLTANADAGADAGLVRADGGNDAGSSTSDGGNSTSDGGSSRTATVLWAGMQCNVRGILAADADWLYFSVSQGVFKVRKDGSGLTQLANFGRAESIAVNSSTVFWVSVDANSVATLQSVDKSGGAPRLIPGVGANGFLVDDSYVYWSSANALNRSTSNGSMASILSPRSWFHLTLRGSTLYGMTSQGIGAIGVDGAGERTLVPGAISLGGVAADTRLFWSPGDSILSATLDGNDVTVLTPFVGTRTLAVDSQHVFFFANAQLFRLSRDGSAPVSLTRDVQEPRGRAMVVDDQSVFWIDGDGSCNSRLMRIAK